MEIIASAWFEEAKNLKINQAIFLRVANKLEQNKLASSLERAREEYFTIDPINASQFFINKVLKNARQYVVIERKYRAPFTALFKDENDIMSKISIDPERCRIIRLMIGDNKPREEVEEILNGLTEEEINRFYPSK